MKNPKEFASTIRKVGHDFPIFLFLHFKASAAAGTHRARDYGNWSFSLLTWALDLWADERHKALITFVIRNADAFKARENKGEFKIARYHQIRAYHLVVIAFNAVIYDPRCRALRCNLQCKNRNATTMWFYFLCFVLTLENEPLTYTKDMSWRPSLLYSK